MDIKKKIIEIFTKANGRKTKYLYTNMMEENTFFLTSILDNEMVFSDIRSYFTQLEIKDNKKEIYDFLDIFYINKKYDLVFNIHKLLSSLNKIKWELDKVKVIKKLDFIEVDNGISKVIVGQSRVNSTHYNNFKYKILQKNIKNENYKVEYYLLDKSIIKDLIYKYKIDNKNSILDGEYITLLKGQIPLLSNNVFLKIRIFEGYYDYGLSSYQEDYISDTFKLNFKIPISKEVKERT